MREGPEENRFKFADVLEDVNLKMDAWDNYKRIEKEKMIAKGMFMYQKKVE